MAVFFLATLTAYSSNSFNFSWWSFNFSSRISNFSSPVRSSSSKLSMNSRLSRFFTLALKAELILIGLMFTFIFVAFCHRMFVMRLFRYCSTLFIREKTLLILDVILPRSPFTRSYRSLASLAIWDSIEAFSRRPRRVSIASGAAGPRQAAH